MRNNHINDLLRRYQAFRKSRGLPAEAQTAGASIQVFKLGKSS